MKDPHDTPTIPPPAAVPEFSEPPHPVSALDRELSPLMGSIERLEHAIDENDRTIKRALNELRTMVLEHYQRQQLQLDLHAKVMRSLVLRVEALEDRCGIPRLMDDGL